MKQDRLNADHSEQLDHVQLRPVPVTDADSPFEENPAFQQYRCNRIIRHSILHSTICFDQHVNQGFCQHKGLIPWIDDQAGVFTIQTDLQHDVNHIGQLMITVLIS